MQLVAKNVYNGLDAYRNGTQEVYTRQQIGQALGYKNPQRAIGFIHSRHKEELDKFSGMFTVNTPGGKQDTFIYNSFGVIRICAYSTQPGARELLFIITDRMQRAIQEQQDALESSKNLVVLYNEMRKESDYKYADLRSRTINNQTGKRLPAKLIRADNLATSKLFCKEYIINNYRSYNSKQALYRAYAGDCWNSNGKYIQLSKRRFNSYYNDVASVTVS